MDQQLWQSHKLVKRMPMTRAEYNIYRDWDLPDDEDGSDEGYLVEYDDKAHSNHPAHEGYISWSPKEQFDNGYSLYDPDEAKGKTLHNSTVSGARKNVSDLQVFGDGDTFKLICKASSNAEDWMKSTKAMEIEGVGCVIQVTTQQGTNVAEALTFVPGVKIIEIDEDKKNGRKIVPMYYSIDGLFD